MSTADDLLNWARAQIGTNESPPSSNNVRYWDDIGMHNFQGQPWCGAFVSAGFRAIGMGSIRFIYCPTGLQTFKAQGRLFQTPQVGDIVFYEFEHDVIVDHTGIVESVSGDHIVAIEGNTVGEGMTGAQADGGGVYRRIRKLSLCHGFGRPAYTQPMTKEEAMALIPNAVDALTCPTGGGWILAKDGGIATYGTAQMLGSWPNKGHDNFLKIELVTVRSGLSKKYGYRIIADDGFHKAFLPK